MEERKPQSIVKNEPNYLDDSDIEIIEEDSNRSVSTQASIPTFRAVSLPQYVFGYGSSGIPDNRLIVEEENNPRQCRQYSKFPHGNWFFCLGCRRTNKRNANAKGRFNGSVFEAPITHFCQPQSKKEVFQEQESLKKNDNIPSRSQRSSGSRIHNSLARRVHPYSNSFSSTASTPTPCSSKTGRGRRRRVQSNDSIAEDDAETNEAILDDNDTNASPEDDDTREDLSPPDVSTLLLSTYDVMIDNKFTDVILISSEGQEIPAHRCVLSKYSAVFEELFVESTELPVRIKCENTDAEIINAGINFCYGKIDGIQGNELKLFNFAKKYDISALKDACVIYFLKLVDSGNVCDIIQIAYENDFEELKEKCLQVLVEKKTEIDPAKLEALPNRILTAALLI